MTTDYKRKLRDFRYAYAFNTQDDGDAMFFVIIKMVWPDTRAGWSDIMYNMDNMKMSQFNNDIPKANDNTSE